MNGILFNMDQWRMESLLLYLREMVLSKVLNVTYFSLLGNTPNQLETRLDKDVFSNTRLVIFPALSVWLGLKNNKLKNYIKNEKFI